MICVRTSGVSDWQRRRSSFNHDWLTSQFDRELYAWIAIFDGESEDDVFNQRSFEWQVLDVWNRRSIEAGDMIREYDHAMTPARLVDVPPLLAMPEDTRCWLRDLVHCLWKARCNADGRKSDVLEALNAADDVFERIHVLYKEKGFKELVGDGEIVELLKEATKRCRLLGDAISNLNRDVEVV